jgi:aspartyl-tRNA(Asn)/glutamyl-tRNA(Gln) amidotransferase subunit A
MIADDPFAGGIRAFAKSVRQGDVTFEEAAQYFLQRIEAYEAQLGAFEYVDKAGALANAAALDRLLTAGTDLGPLMGVPMGVKDIITVEGMPVTNGSNAATSHLNGAEGSLIKHLRQLGCVLLGKTKTVEFALGATGVNEARGTPWNPHDLQVHRTPGGSSSGSAVATAAGLCAFALGTDTGGSVRIPACYNGLFGHKTTVGLWPTDGVFPLSPTLDSIGPICRSADDAAVIHEALHTTRAVTNVSLRGLRLAKPHPVFFDELDAEVKAGFDAIEKVLRDAGAQITDIRMEESIHRNDIFPLIVGAELIASLTREAFHAAADDMDSITRQRAAVGLELSAVEYVNAQRAHQHWQRIARESLRTFDAWIAPTVPMLPKAVADLADPLVAERALQSSRNTQLGNLYGLCAATLPVHHLIGNTLPVGFQIMMSAGQDSRLLGLCRAIQRDIGVASPPTMQ